MSVKVFLATDRLAHVAGLFGNANGDPSDDLVTRDGSTVITTPAPFSLFYKTYAQSWRITDASSLFDYPIGENTESPDITNLNFPTDVETSASLPADQLQAAAATCQSIGVTSDWSEACALDVALSNDAGAASTFVAAPPVLAPFVVLSPCAACTAGQSCCDGQCTALAVDRNNCGACGLRCTVAGATCANGTCGCQPPKSASCGVAPATACVDLTADTNNCGTCGRACSGATPVCSGGSCVPACNTASDQTQCGTQCVVLGNDLNNCGTCGTACAPSQICSGGVCVAPSTAGVGCADGTREGFQSQATFPAIAACAGGWDGESGAAGFGGVFPSPLRTTSVTCAQNGNSGSNPNGTGCSAADLCAPGWHICAGGEVIARASGGLTSPAQTDGCAATTWPPSSFFAAAIGSTGCFECAEPSGTLTGPSCTNASCAVGCQANPAITNDLFGCGTEGVVIGTCGDVDRSSNDLCGSLDAGWACGTDGTRESVNATHVPSRAPGTMGGVLCCASL